MAAGPRKSIMRSLGEFFGHVAHGFKSDVRRDRQVVRHETEERSADTPDGSKLVLRRTTIEEVEVRHPPAHDARRDAGA
ncbi:MAG: hypothetical protein ACKVU4_03775 [Phycisphaerales bacterium]